MLVMVKKTNLWLAFVLALPVVLSGLLLVHAPKAEAAPGYQYIRKIPLSDLPAACEDFDDDCNAKIAARDSFSAEQLRTALFGIGYECTGSASNPTCEKYYWALDQSSSWVITNSSDDAVRFEAECQFYDARPSDPGGSYPCSTPVVHVSITGNPPDYSHLVFGEIGQGGGTDTVADPYGVLDDLEEEVEEEVEEQQSSGETDTETVGGNDSCESADVIGWIGCPLINMLSGALNTLDSQIQRLLEVDRDSYFDSTMRAAWINIRNIAYALLIPTMLIMVIGTALGFEVFSAYTVKKALPRMIVAVVFITFSWNICGFLINLSNVVGSGVLGVMTAPFGDDVVGDMSLNSLFDADVEDGSAAASAFAQWAALGSFAVFLVAFITVPGGLGILLLYLGSALLFVTASFLVLILRQMFIIALVMLAPLAILAWIFPGNDKPWKLWWVTFSRLLIMFPLIMAIIAAGRIFAYSINANPGGGLQGGFLSPLLKLSAYILPYVFIPLTFKFAGGIFANLAGMVNDRNKGLFDRLKKKRGEEFGKIRERGERGALVDQEKAAGTKGLRGRWLRGINKAGGWGFDPMNSARIAMGTERGKAVLAQINMGKLEATQKLAEVMGRMGFNAEELSALSVGREGKRADGSRYHIAAWNGTGKDLERIAVQLEQSVDEQDRIGAGHLRTNAPMLLEAFKSEEYGRADLKAAAGMAYASQGFATPEEIARLANEADGYKYKATARMAYKKDDDGNFELDAQGNRIQYVAGYDYEVEERGKASGFGGAIKTNAELLSARGGGLGKPGYTVRVGANGEFIAPSGKARRADPEDEDSAIVGGIDGAKIEQVIRYGVGEIQQAKGSQFENQLGDAYEYIMTADPNTKWTDASGAQKKIADVKAGVEETLVGVLNSYAPADVKKRAAKILAKSKAQIAQTQGADIPIKDAGGKVTGYERRILNAEEAKVYAQEQVNGLMRRGSGIFNIDEIEQQRQQQAQQNENE